MVRGRRRSFVTRCRWRIEAALYDVAASFVRRCSPHARLALGTGIGVVVWALVPSLRRRAAVNVRLAFGTSKSTHEIDTLVRASLVHFARIGVETLALGEGHAPVDIEGMEHLRAALARGRGVVCITAHFGHWELARWAVAQAGIVSVPIARPLANPLLQARVGALRGAQGAEMIPTRGALRPALLHLRRGGLLAVLGDQRSAKQGRPVNLLGRRAYVASSPAVLAIRTGAGVVVGCGYLGDDGTWRVRLEPEVARHRTGDATADAEAITHEYAAFLDGWIRERPEQWLWTHARLGE